MNLSKLRRGQREALETVLARLKKSESYTTIVLPTRYGKSDVMRLVAVEGERNQCLGWSLVLSPLQFLRDQFLDADQVKSFSHRYDIDRDFARRCYAWSGAHEQLFGDPKRLIVSATMAMATQNVAICGELADEVRHRTGRPLVVQIDECQEVSTVKRRGELVRALVDRGASIILYTATPIRADNQLIPGFDVEELDARTRERYERTGEIDEPTGREILRVYGMHQRLTRLIAHHETTFRQAWEEKPSPICRVTRDVIDVDVAKVTDDKTIEPRKLSACDIKTARSVLGRAVRNHEVIAKGADMLVKSLAERRAARPTAAGIVFTGNDQANDEEDNRHAKTIEKAIKHACGRYGIRLATRIVTMKSEEGRECAEAITQFRAGDGDVLIVKQIGGAGLDCERLKVELDLSSVRTVASVMQRIMRTATPWGDCKVATVITLADPMMQAIWDDFVVAQGGQAMENWRTTDEWLEGEQLKKDDEPDRYVVNGAGLGLFDDSDGSVGVLSAFDGVARVLAKWPWIGDHLTKPEIARDFVELLKTSGNGSQESMADFAPASTRCIQLRDQANAIVSERAKAEGIPYTTEFPEDWINFHRQAWAQIKRRCGVEPRTKLETITNPDLLTRMVAVAQELFSNEKPS